MLVSKEVEYTRQGIFMVVDIDPPSSCAFPKVAGNCYSVVTLKFIDPSVDLSLDKVDH